MLRIDADSLEVIRPELLPGETVLWAGRPTSGVIFHHQDRLLIPFSLFWGGITLACSIGLLIVAARGDRSALLGLLVALPMAGIGQYAMWGRFLLDESKKKRTFYAVTDRRVLAVQTCDFKGCAERNVAMANIDSSPRPIKEPDSRGIGTVRFTPLPLIPTGWSRPPVEVFDALTLHFGPTLVDIEDVDSVCQLISALQAKKSEAAVTAILHERHSR
jgi:hypothetical protein